MASDKTFKQISTRVTRSKHFQDIMKKYDAVGSKISVRKFYDKYVTEIDPEITWRQWEYFMLKYHNYIRKQNEKLLKKVADNEITEKQLEENSLKKILQIADFTLQEIVENPNQLKKVPLDDRMRWLFSTMKARDSRMQTLTKVQAEKRKTTMWEDMMEGAQYGAISSDEMGENESEDEVKKNKGEISLNPSN